MVIANPMQIKRSKELDDNLLIKNDRKDAFVIVRCIKDGRFNYPRILKDMGAELRVGKHVEENYQNLKLEEGVPPSSNFKFPHDK